MVARLSLCRAASALCMLAIAGPVACRTSSNPQTGADATDARSEAELIQATERERVRALVDANLDVARRLHADDFQVINPLGRVSSRERYLSGVAAGTTDYLAWDTDSVTVRLYGRSAVIRYRSQVDVTVRGEAQPRLPAWNTGVYEKRGGQWQIVWFQVTYIR